MGWIAGLIVPVLTGCSTKCVESDDHESSDARSFIVQIPIVVDMTSDQPAVNTGPMMDADAKGQDPPGGYSDCLPWTLTQHQALV